MRKVLYRTGGSIVCAALILLGLSISTVWAQSTGTILGTVRDSTGAVVPNATVTVRSLETGLVRTVTSGANGSYRVAALPVGNYELRAEQAGFQTEVRSGVGLAVGQEAVVNFSLQVGAVEQTIEVTGEAPLVNTTSGSLGTLVDEHQVSELPLNGRNYADLTLLQPGVVQHRQPNTSLQSAGTWMSINGAPPRSNFFVMDGTPMNNYADASTASVGANTLGVDAIREWRVVTNAFSAEYGMRMGGQMVIVTKSGTNELHGSVFEYLRNDKLDARNFFDLKSEAFSGRLPAFRRNQYGGSLGGPIKPDKLFFFATYEGLKERLGVTTITRTIGAGCQGAADATITNTACPQLGTTASAKIAPVMAPLLALYPLPNLPNDRYTFPATQPIDENYGMVRGDVNLSANDSLFMRYTIDKADTSQVMPYPQFRRIGFSSSHFVTLSESHTFGSAMVGTFRFSFSQPDIGADSETEIAGPQYSFVDDHAIGQLSITGTDGLGTDSNTPARNHLINAFSYSGDLFYSLGNHSLKFGVLINDYRPLSMENSGSYYGSLSFNSMANFLRGISNSYGGEITGNIRRRDFLTTTYGFYIQDDLRAFSNLTLNLGLRYEFHTEYKDEQGRNSALVDIRRDSEFTVGHQFLNPSLKNISPRFGFAWDVRGDGQTAVRGGFGLLYDVAAWHGAMNNGLGSYQPYGLVSSVSSTEFPQYAQITSLPLTFPPETLSKSVTTMDLHIKNPYLMTYSFTVDRQLPYDMGLSVGYTGSLGRHLVSYKPANPRPPTILSDGRYFWAGTEPRVNPNFTTINQVTSALSSWYNAMQFSVTKRLSQGLQFQSAYTFGKLIDQRGGLTAPDTGGSPIVANQLDPMKWDQGRSDYTTAHTWRFNAIYRLPQALGRSGVRGALLNGWWVSGILTAQTGLPMTVTTGGTDRSRRLGGANRPDLNVGRNSGNITSGTTAGCTGVDGGQKLGGPELYYDPCAFSLEPNGFQGTEGRNIIDGPGEVVTNFSLVKDTKLGLLGEGGNVQFRVETFNLLNRANFARPSLGVFSAPSATPLATAGEISETQGTSRQIQLSLKVSW